MSTEPYGVGLHNDIPEATYHALPGLSSTGVKTILDDSPAQLRHAQENPAGPKKVFDLGHAVHEMVLGVGMGLVVVDAEEWRTDKIKAEVKAIREAGKIPVKPSEHAKAKAMVESLLGHDDARAFLEAPGRSEVSALADFTVSGQTVRLRGRFDRLLDAGVITDVKTSRTANPRRLRFHARDLRWDTQAADYRLLASLLDLGDDLPFVHLVVESEPPFLPAVYRLTADDLAVGHADVMHAIETYAWCQRTGNWPGYPAGVLPLNLPPRRGGHTDIEELAS